MTENHSVQDRRLSIHVCRFNEDIGKEGVVIPGTWNARDLHHVIGLSQILYTGTNSQILELNFRNLDFTFNVTENDSAVTLIRGLGIMIGSRTLSSQE